MKKALTILLILLNLVGIHAQVDTTYVENGDDIVITADPYTGTIKWQHSPDGTSWADIPGETSGIYSFTVSGISGDEDYYRSVVQKDLCSFPSTIELLIISAETTGCGELESITDIDGNVYSVVTIGSQCWMAENLKTSQYRNGDAIPTGLSAEAWENTDEGNIGAYAVYNDDPANDVTYGKLYNWYAVDDSRGLCPTGWHVSSDAEWKEMEMHLGMSLSEANSAGYRGTDEGGKMKSTSSLWNSPNVGATNESGFSGLPGGRRNYGGSFGDIGGNGYWWSSTELSASFAWYRKLYYDGSGVYRFDYYKRTGRSVRCLRD